MILNLLFAIVPLAITQNALASFECYDHGRPLDFNEDQVFQWKKQAIDQFQGRAHVHGVLKNYYGDLSSLSNHDRYQVELTDSHGAVTTVEVIFSKGFGAVPIPEMGIDVEVCGDYITSNKSNSRYAASRDKAVIHWVHMSTDTKKHDAGFLVLGNELHGWPLSSSWQGLPNQFKNVR